MPYHWLPPDPEIPDTGNGPPPRRLHLRPWRALRPAGFSWFIGVTAALIALPLFAVIATPVFWGLLPFLIATMAAIWWALKRSWSDNMITEDLILSRDQVSLTRLGPRGRRQSWEANPHWVSVHLHPHGGPVPDYLTLRGNGREVEIGAFLSPEERGSLQKELHAAFAAIREAPV